jgi:hypothetical protein
MTTPHECINTQPNSPKSKPKGRTTLQPARSSRGFCPHNQPQHGTARPRTHTPAAGMCGIPQCVPHKPSDRPRPLSATCFDTLCAWTTECIARPVSPAQRTQHTTTQYKRRYTCTSLSASCILHWIFGMIPTPLNPQPYIGPQHSARLLSLHTQPHTHPRRNE